jgi:hypothetical protein
MSRSSILIVLGAFALLTPFSGFPETVRTLIIVGFGAAVVGYGVAERSKEQHRLIVAANPAPVHTQELLAAAVPEVIAPPAPPEPVPEPLDPPAESVSVAAPEPFPAEAVPVRVVRRRAPRKTPPKSMSPV